VNGNASADTLGRQELRKAGGPLLQATVFPTPLVVGTTPVYNAYRTSGYCKLLQCYAWNPMSRSVSDRLDTKSPRKVLKSSPWARHIFQSVATWAVFGELGSVREVSVFSLSHFAVPPFQGVGHSLISPKSLTLYCFSQENITVQRSNFVWMEQRDKGSGDFSRLSLWHFFCIWSQWRRRQSRIRLYSL